MLPYRRIVEGPAARGPPKSLNAGPATAPMAVTEPNRSQSPRCPCKRPPILPSHGPAPPPGDGSRLFVALAVDWFKRDGENGKLGDVSKLTKWSPAGMGSGGRRKASSSPPPFFSARLRPRLSNYRRPPTP